MFNILETKIFIGNSIFGIMKIKGYENYEVTCSGDVLNSKTGKALKPTNNGKGYLQVVLCKNGKGKKFLIHRLVAEAFIPNPLNLPCVNHKDENPSNNFVFLNEDGSVDEEKSNLEWCTHEYNNRYGTRTERMVKTKSKPILQLRKDGSLVRVWPSSMEIERQVHYSSGNITKCCLGKRHSAYGFKWCYTLLFPPAVIPIS